MVFFHDILYILHYSYVARAVPLLECSDRTEKLEAAKKKLQPQQAPDDCLHGYEKL